MGGGGGRRNSTHSTEHRSLTASLMRDMAVPARAAIVDRLAEPRDPCFSMPAGTLDSISPYGNNSVTDERH